MAGEVDGTLALLYMLVGDAYTLLGGQTSHSQTLSSSAIEVQNKSAGEGTRLLSGHGTLSETFSCDLIFNSDVGFLALRDAKASRLLKEFKLVKPNLPDETFSGVVTNYNESSTNTTALTGSVSISVGVDALTGGNGFSVKTFGGGAENGGGFVDPYDDGSNPPEDETPTTSFYASVAANNAIDFWKLDESGGVSASNSGGGESGFTLEKLVHQSIVTGHTSTSSLVTGLGRSLDLQGSVANVVSGVSAHTGSVFPRSNTWGLEFAIDFTSPAEGMNVISFWDEFTFNPEGVDTLFKIYVSDVAGDVLSMMLYTTNDDITYTQREVVLVPSIAALQEGFSYLSIFFVSGINLVCKVNDVETLNEDISTWEARLSNIHVSSRFRIGAVDKSATTGLVLDGRVDVISTYASNLGDDFDLSRTYNLWEGAEVTPPETSPFGWDPVASYLSNDGTDSWTFTEGSRVATQDIATGSASLTGLTVRNTGKRYIEYQIIAGDDDTAIDFGDINFGFRQIGLTDGIRVAGEAGDGSVGNIQGFNLIAPNAFDPSVARYAMVSNTSNASSSTSSDRFENSGTVVGIVFDFDLQLFQVYINNVLLIDLTDNFGFSGDIPECHPFISVYQPVNWSIRVNEELTRFVYPEHITGTTIPWSEPQVAPPAFAQPALSGFLESYGRGSSANPVLYTKGDTTTGFSNVRIEDPGSQFAAAALWSANTGKKYLEFKINTITSGSVSISFGVRNFKWMVQGHVAKFFDGEFEIRDRTTTVDTVTGFLPSDGDVVGMMLDFDAGTFIITRNGLDVEEDIIVNVNAIDFPVSPFVLAESGFDGIIDIECRMLASDLEFLPSGFEAWITTDTMGLYNKDVLWEEADQSTGVDVVGNTGTKNGNTQFGASWSSIVGLRPMPVNNNLYFEATVSSFGGIDPTGQRRAGVGLNFGADNSTNSRPGSNQSTGIAPGTINSGALVNNGVFNTVGGPEWHVNDIIGCAVSWDDTGANALGVGSSMTMDVYVNNIFQMQFTNPAPSSFGTYYPIVGVDNLVPVSAVMSLFLNTSDQTYTPPLGFDPWE